MKIVGKALILAVVFILGASVSQFVASRAAAKDLCDRKGFDIAQKLEGVWYCSVSPERGYRTERLDKLYPNPEAKAEQK